MPAHTPARPATRRAATALAALLTTAAVPFLMPDRAAQPPVGHPTANAPASTPATGGPVDEDPLTTPKPNVTTTPGTKPTPRANAAPHP
ncbi:hypothetical protein [Actinomadura kijaniata]|uniref:hypothetical protein n=1 Tax=Actinomadura kijaniata TaxID=46161 RepID=UPI000AA0D425|nr:hypothetical protein [Actinomadura kijaniata]